MLCLISLAKFKTIVNSVVNDPIVNNYEPTFSLMRYVACIINCFSTEKSLVRFLLVLKLIMLHYAFILVRARAP